MSLWKIFVLQPYGNDIYKICFSKSIYWVGKYLNDDIDIGDIKNADY